MKRYWFILCGIITVLCFAAVSYAGVPLTLYKSHAGNIDFKGTGGTLRTESNNGDPCAVTYTDSESLSGIPAGATVIAAYLYWAGSYSENNGSNQTTPDYEITFESQVVTADRTFLDEYDADERYFSGFKDVTGIVAAKGNGLYTFADLTVNTGEPHCGFACVISGWAMIVVYEDPAEPLRVINIHDGFEIYYRSSTTQPPGIPIEIEVEINNFEIPADPRDGKHGHITWDGDPDINDSNENLYFNDRGTPLTDPLNDENEQYNSTINFLGSNTSYGVDFDVYDISSYLSEGDTSAITIYSAGRDQVILTAEIMSVTNIPVTDLSIDKTHSGSFEVGEQGTYSIIVTNNGPNSVPGTDTIIVEDTIPAGLTYVSSSGTGWTPDTSSDPIITWSYTGPLADGDSLPPITLNVDVGAAAFPEVTNTAAFSSSMSLSTYDNISGNNQDDDLTVVGSDLTTSIMTVQDLNGGDAEPGDELRYTITIIESGGINASGVRVTDTMPSDVEGLTVVSIPSGATDNSSPASGLLDIQNIFVSANTSVTIVFKVTISAGTFQGTPISNSADIDNPTGGGVEIDAPTIIVSDTSSQGGGNKWLYLSPGQILSRIPPSASQDVTINRNSSAEWTMTPVLEADLTVNAETIAVILWLRRIDRTGDRNIIVELESSTGQAIGSRTRTLTLGTTPQEFLFNVPVSSSVQLNIDQGIVLSVRNNRSRAFSVTTDDTRTSRINLDVSPVISVDSVSFYDAAYNGGSPISTILLGNTFYVRAVISDPFGSYDITDATLELENSESNIIVSGSSMTEAYDSGAAEKIYEYPVTLGPSDPTGTWTATVTGVEGTEGTITDLGIGTIQVVDTSIVEFTDAVGDPVDGYDMTGGSGTACVEVEDAGRNQNPSLVETATVTVSDATTGDDETLILTETGSNTGIFFNCFPLSTSSGSDNDGTLNVIGGYDISVSYTDTLSNTVTDTVFIPTRAVLSSFKAYEEGDQIIVEWETVFEVGTLGFFLFRKDQPGAKYTKLTKQLLPGLLVSSQGGTYQFVDTTAVSGKQYKYKLVEIETRGRKLVHGPFAVIVDGPGIDFYKGATVKASRKRNVDISRQLFSGPVNKGFRRKMHRISKEKIKRSNASRGAKRAARALKKQKKGHYAKIPVMDLNFNYLNADDIAHALGIKKAKVNRLIMQNRLKLSQGGMNIPYLPLKGNSGIYFLGEPIDTVYTDENCYFLKMGKGKRMMSHGRRTFESENDHDTFIDTIHMEENNWAVVNQCDDPDEDYWMWEYIFSGIPNFDKKIFSIHVEGIADSSNEALLTVNLIGGNDTQVDPDHHITVDLNNERIGEGLWDGTDRISLDCSFDQSLLNQGDNAIEVIGHLDTGADLSVFYIDSFDLQYERDFMAIDNRLVFPAEEKGEYITVTDFTTQDIVVAEITDPQNPVIVKRTRITGSNSSYSVSFRSPSSGASFLAMARDAFVKPVSVFGRTNAGLKRRKNSVDYLVITPFELKEAAQVLADYREEQGLDTMVVDLEDIMDAFNHGIYNPLAIRDFLSYAYHNYRKRPEFIVLIGDGTYDYKGRKGFEDNLMPPVMVNTPDGLFASDNSLADVILSDGVPEMAVGRLPVATPEELYTVIDKIKQYESHGTGLWTERVLMLADDPDGGGDFSANSDDIADLLPMTFSKKNIYLSEHTLEDARQQVLDGINQGVFLLNYLGHGGLDRFAEEGLFVTEDVSMLENGGKLPVVAAMTCVTGHFAMPGYDALSEALILHDKGGAIAVWAPTGLSINSQAKILDMAFFKAVFEGHERVLGKAILIALEEFKERSEASYMLDIYNLLGDPALRMW